MFSKLVSLSTTSYHTEKRTTFIELVELVDSVEKVLQSTSFFQMTLNSLEKFKTITTPRLKKCHKILRTLTPAENNEQLLGEPT
jgi:iron-sulfur cluster repair protein YtfE (RIC family)